VRIKVPIISGCTWQTSAQRVGAKQLSSRNEQPWKAYELFRFGESVFGFIELPACLKFSTEDTHAFGRFDTNLHSASTNSDDLYANGIANLDTLSGFAG
jgi:hypothetical protein